MKYQRLPSELGQSSTAGYLFILSFSILVRRQSITLQVTLRLRKSCVNRGETLQALVQLAEHVYQKASTGNLFYR
jgi:hypothetical protein